jgi:integrase
MDEMRFLISRAKEVCSRRELAFLAMATTYGLRREEIGTLEISDGMVKVNTVKGGEVTTHLVPDEVKKFTNGYHGCNDVRYLTRVFQRVVGKVGIDVGGKGYGWHSIRRALASELVVREVSLLNILRFMRWSDATVQGEIGMLAIYVRRDQAEVDRCVFRVHPFLAFWRDGDFDGEPQ